MNGSCNKNDILCGRGKAITKRNTFFYEFITLNKEDYHNSNKAGKSRIAYSILQSVKASKGRFMKQDHDSKCWVELKERKALEKIRQALRDANTFDQMKKKLAEENSYIPYIPMEVNKINNMESYNIEKDKKKIEKENYQSKKYISLEKNSSISSLSSTESDFDKESNDLSKKGACSMKNFTPLPPNKRTKVVTKKYEDVRKTNSLDEMDSSANRSYFKSFHNENTSFYEKREAICNKPLQDDDINWNPHISSYGIESIDEEVTEKLSCSLNIFCDMNDINSDKNHSNFSEDDFILKYLESCLDLEEESNFIN